MPRALLVIDVQNEYFTGALPISHPTGHLANILAVMDVAKAQDMSTAVIRHHQPDPASPVFCIRTYGWELHPEVASRSRDILIDKQLPGSFTGTNLEPRLQSQVTFRLS